MIIQGRNKSKLILSIKTRNKSFNLLEQLNKDFGVVFHPKSTVVSVENFIKEKANGKSTSEASSQIRQGNSERKGLVGKAKEDKEQQKIISLEDTSDEVSSSYGLKREDR
jgi:DNA polymerase II small subunit/DNA polymerase delta subunit B